MSSGKQEFLVGRVVGFHGLRGQLKFQPVLADRHLLAKVKKAWANLTSGRRQDLQVKSISQSGRQCLIAFQDIENREQAEFLLGSEIYALRDQLGPLGENQWWQSDLIGISVFTTGGSAVGTISGIIDGHAQILEIKPHGEQGQKRILVPFVHALVPVVDPQSRRVEVVDMPGLLEPQ